MTADCVGPSLTREQLRQAYEDHRVVTPDQAAEAIGVTRNIIDVWASRGRLPRLASRPTYFLLDDVYDAQRKYKVRAAEAATRGGMGVRRIPTM